MTPWPDVSSNRSSEGNPKVQKLDCGWGFYCPRRKDWVRYLSSDSWEHMIRAANICARNHYSQLMRGTDMTKKYGEREVQMTMQTETESIPAAADNQKMIAHLMCERNWPPQFGEIALCGERLLGIPAALNEPLCRKCREVEDRHISSCLYCVRPNE